MAKQKSISKRIQKKEIVLFLLAVLVGTVLSECALQILHKVHPSFIIKKRIGGNHPADLVHHSDVIDYELTPNFKGRDINPNGDFDVQVIINTDGIRDFEEELNPEQFKIMIIGDSIMYGEGVKLEENFPAILEKRLQETVNASARVIKAGVPGYSERQALDLLESKFELFKPQVVILGVTPTESWRNVTGYRNEQGFIVDSRLKKQYFRFGNELFASNIQSRPLAYLEAWSEAHFLLPTFLRQRMKFITEKLSHRRKVESAQIEETEINSLELLPTIGQLDRFLLLSDKLNFTPVLFIKGYRLQAGRIISDYAKERGAAALDLAPLFKVGEGKVLYTFPHDGHWNSSTHKMVSEILYNFLVTSVIPAYAGVTVEKIKAA